METRLKFIPTSTVDIESAAEATANVIFEILFKDIKQFMEFILALVGIILSIYIAVKWWRIVLPLVGILLLIVVVVVSYAVYEKNDIEATRAALISDNNEAKERATSIDKKWIAESQLGDSSLWKYKLVAYIPDRLDDNRYNLMDRMGYTNDSYDWLTE